MAIEPRERGAAAINITLSKGIITVTHAEAGAVLQQWVANEGDWETLWKTIISLQLAGGQV